VEESPVNLTQVQKWIRLAFRKRPVRPRRRLGSSSRLFLECLETRNLLSTVTWINPNGGDWDTASNWLDTTTGTNHVPTANDNAVIAISGITVTHTSFFTSDTVNSLTSKATLSVSSGSLSFNNASTTQNLILSGGTVNAGASLAVANLTQSNGALTGSGNVTIDKVWDWTGGTVSGSGATEVQGNTEIGGGSPFGPTLSGRTLDNFGSLIVDNNSSLLFANNATLNNRSGAQLVLHDTAALGNFFGNSGTLNNAGKLIRSGLNNTTSTIDVAVDNTGTVDVQAGTLNAAAGLTNEGTFTLEPGALATLTGGSNSGGLKLQDGSQLSLAGTFSLLAGSTTAVETGSQLALTGIVTQLGGAAVTLASNSILNVGPNFSSSNYILDDGASVTGPGVVVLSGFSPQMTVNGAARIQNLTLANGTLTVNAGGSLEVANLTQSGGTLTGSGNVSLDKVWDWTGGAMSGSGQTVNKGTATLGNSPFGISLDQRTLNNVGNATLLDGDAIEFQNNAVWNNLAGSTLVLGNNSSLGNFFGNSGTLNNAGLITDTGPTSQANIQLSPGVTNSGTLDLQGILNLNGPYTQTAAGTLTIVFGAGGTNGELKVNGQASLDGTLKVNTPKGFSPTVGQTFTIMTFSSVIGDFSTFTGLNLKNGKTLTPSHNGTTYTLTVTAS
jgi:hypothetical protein